MTIIIVTHCKCNHVGTTTMCQLYTADWDTDTNELKAKRRHHTGDSLGLSHFTTNKIIQMI